jgi:hypothetical protein
MSGRSSGGMNCEIATISSGDAVQSACCKSATEARGVRPSNRSVSSLAILSAVAAGSSDTLVSPFVRRPRKRASQPCVGAKQRDFDEDSLLRLSYRELSSISFSCLDNSLELLRSPIRHFLRWFHGTTLTGRVELDAAISQLDYGYWVPDCVIPILPSPDYRRASQLRWPADPGALLKAHRARTPCPLSLTRVRARG